MKKIVFLPLDERPCNADFARMLFNGERLNMVTPQRLGQKKTAACREAVEAFLLTECADAHGVVLSMDMLLYGGLIPSRLHTLSREDATRRMALVPRLKAQNPKLLIYAFQCIMRCPQYSSSDEEPDYYGDCGRAIYLAGDAQHRCRLGLCRPEEARRLREKVPEAALRDYLDRRAFNLDFNLEALALLGAGWIDLLVIPQDDSARYGFTAMDQERVRRRIAELSLGARVLMYPGADELGLSLTARMALYFAGLRPRVYVKYAATGAPAIVPLYEDRALGETVKYQLTAAGCRVATSLAEADMVLAVSAPGSSMREAAEQPAAEPGYAIERTLVEFAAFLKDCLADGKIVTVGDNAYANGGDLELIGLLDQLNLLGDLHGYAGWNTSSNTLGTAIAEGIHALVEGRTPAHMDFLALRYVEDAGYCGFVRKVVTDGELAKRGLNALNVGAQRGDISAVVRERLNAFVLERLPSVARHIRIDDVWMPWQRMFEVGLSTRWHGVQ